MNYFTLAWRNIWRNKRRTLITAASVAFAVFYAILMRSMQLGVYDRAIINTVESFAGYYQVHAKGYWDDQGLDNSFTLNDTLLSIVARHPEVKAYLPRIQSFALASTGKQTKPSILIGMNPELEEGYSVFNRQVSAGDYIANNDSSVVVGEGLAAFLNIIRYDTTYVFADETADTVVTPVMVNDTIVLFGQGYHGITAAAKYKVKGIVKVPLPDLNRRLVLMPLPLAQDHLSLGGKVTALMMMIDDLDNTDGAVAALKTDLDMDEYEVMAWPELMEELMQQIQADQGGGLLMLFILYLIVGFGIFGTVLMMASERQKEFGVMNALGMQKMKISTLTAVELLFMSLLGLFAGMLISMPIITYLHYNPIPLTGEVAKAMDELGWEAVIDFALKPGFIINQGIVIVLLVIIASFYPLVKIRKMNLISALRS